jgi:hypothetical protein
VRLYYDSCAGSIEIDGLEGFVEVLGIKRGVFEEVYVLERRLYGELLELKTWLEQEVPCSRATLKKGVNYPAR